MGDARQKHGLDGSHLFAFEAKPRCNKSKAQAGCAILHQSVADAIVGERLEDMVP